MATAADRDHLDRKMLTIEHCALFRRSIRLTCPKCRHVRILDAVTIWWRFHRKGWDDHLPAAVRHFYCIQCWTQRQVRIRPNFMITGDPATGQQLPYPPESEWKRLVSRFRS